MLSSGFINRSVIAGKSGTVLDMTPKRTNILTASPTGVYMTPQRTRANILTASPVGVYYYPAGMPRPCDW